MVSSMGIKLRLQVAFALLLLPSLAPAQGGVASPTKKPEQASLQYVKSSSEYTWIFSGIGTAVLGSIGGLIWKRRRLQKGYSKTQVEIGTAVASSIAGQTLTGDYGNQLSVRENNGSINQGTQFNFHHPIGPVQFHIEGIVEGDRPKPHVFSPKEIFNRIRSANAFEVHEVRNSFVGAQVSCCARLSSANPHSGNWLMNFKDPQNSLWDYWVTLTQAQVDQGRFRAFQQDQLYNIVAKIESAAAYDIHLEGSDVDIRPTSSSVSTSD
jgi:hypothetical protein